MSEVTPDEDSNGSTDSVVKSVVCEDAFAEKASEEMQTNLNNLKNLLKQPLACRYLYSEFFYSPVDSQIFLADNEFMSLVRENLPNMRMTKMRLCEWRQIRRLIGKPRRLSSVFLTGERIALDAKRTKIRELYSGHLTQLDPDSVDLPTRLPRQLMVGTKVFARFNGLILNAAIDAVQDCGYRVVFEKEEHPSVVVKEDQVMCVSPPEVLNISYFLTTNKANLKLQVPTQTAYPHALVEKVQHPVITGYTMDPHSHISIPVFNQPAKKDSSKNDIVGNFPVRMLVIIVKMCKLLDHKRGTLKQFKTLNDDALKMQRYGYKYPEKFLKVMAEVVIELESINRMLRVYAEALNPYRQSLVSQRSRANVTDRPEVLKKTCITHAGQIAKHCAAVVEVKNPASRDVIAALSSMILQIRYLGQHAVNSRSCAEEVQILTDTLKDLKEMIPPEAMHAFQSGVEIHMKQIFNSLLKIRPPNSNSS